MRPRDESAHPVVKDAIEKGYLDTGRYYEINGFASRKAASDGRRSVYNACRHLGVSCSSTDANDVLELTDTTWRLRFRIFSKDAARRHILDSTGGDPSKLAYNPFQRAEGPMVDDQGRLIR